MGESTRPLLKVQFDWLVQLDSLGATITSDTGTLACRELDDAMGLTESADDFLKESRAARKTSAIA